MNKSLTSLPLVFFAVWMFVAQTDAIGQSANMKLAHEAFDAAKDYKAQGDLTRAANMFKLAQDNAAEDSNLYYEAKEELTYYIPLMKIQRLLWDGNAEAAQQALLVLQQEFEDQPIRRQQIGEIVSGLRNSAETTQATPQTEISEQLLMRQVKALLHGYYVEHQQFPTSAADLSSLLPAGQPPLTTFDVKRYSSYGSGYLLMLQSRKNPDHVLTIQNTGLMQ